LERTRQQGLVFVDNAIAIIVDAVALLDCRRVHGIVGIIAVAQTSGGTTGSDKCAIIVEVRALWRRELGLWQTPTDEFSAAFSAAFAAARFWGTDRGAEVAGDAIVVRRAAESVDAVEGRLEFTA
jgi:hypothetical protein